MSFQHSCELWWYGVFKIIDFPLYGSVAILTILIGGKGQRLGDIVAGTMVISTKKKSEFTRFKMPTFEEDYQPKYFQASSLTDEQVKLIKKVLDLSDAQVHRKAFDVLVEKIENSLSIESDEPNRIFLNQF